jgi:hypothetical protein
MDKGKKTKLAKKGWKVGTVAEFLDLSAEESAYIEMDCEDGSRRPHGIDRFTCEIAPRIGRFKGGTGPHNFIARQNWSG